MCVFVRVQMCKRLKRVSFKVRSQTKCSGILKFSKLRHVTRNLPPTLSIPASKIHYLLFAKEGSVSRSYNLTTILYLVKGFNSRVA